MALVLQIQATAENLDLGDWYSSLVAAMFPMSLSVNALVTILIVYRIITVYSDIRRLKSDVQAVSVHGNGRRDSDLYPVISILIESGLITFVAQLAQSIAYKYAIVAFSLVGTSTVVMLFVSVSCRFLICYLTNMLLNNIYLFIFFTGNFDERCPCAC